MKLNHTTSAEDAAIEDLKGLNIDAIVQAIEGLDALITEKSRMIDDRDETIRDLQTRIWQLEATIEEANVNRINNS
jgi:peptidoglycan hydrolase CwlO-like protein